MSACTVTTGCSKRRRRQCCRDNRQNEAAAHGSSVRHRDDRYGARRGRGQGSGQKEKREKSGKREWRATTAREVMRRDRIAGRCLGLSDTPRGRKAQWVS